MLPFFFGKTTDIKLLVDSNFSDSGETAVWIPGYVSLCAHGMLLYGMRLGAEELWLYIETAAEPHEQYRRRAKSKYPV